MGIFFDFKDIPIKTLTGNSVLEKFPDISGGVATTLYDTILLIIFLNRLKGCPNIMMHCGSCNKDFDTEENVFPICGLELLETEENPEDETDQLVATMTITGIL